MNLTGDSRHIADSDVVALRRARVSAWLRGVRRRGAKKEGFGKTIVFPKPCTFQ
jgi:hypothetical protein